ncbi:Uncharacterised protein [Hathewaya histolytica]|uniref:Uncharacterized protein n=1 Tax=Hathewaya histolytica TaxID=1498 RepID=A0A4U9QW95_HATHI|nr:Uncharacterised protein [Hathewaya histolytica]
MEHKVIHVNFKKKSLKKRVKNKFSKFFSLLRKSFYPFKKYTSRKNHNLNHKRTNKKSI